MSAEDLLGVPVTDEDDSIVGGPKTPEQIVAQKRLQQVQAQVDEVVDIMRTNVDKVIEKDEKLSKLNYVAENLEENASHFKQQAGRLKRKFFMQNMKMIVIMGVIGLIILLIIIMKLLPEKRSLKSDIEELETKRETLISTEMTFTYSEDGELNESNTNSPN